jgi:hypothetical protein
VAGEALVPGAASHAVRASFSSEPAGLVPEQRSSFLRAPSASNEEPLDAEAPSIGALQAPSRSLDLCVETPDPTDLRPHTFGTVSR